MALEMRQRIIIGEPADMLVSTDQLDQSLIYNYVRTVRIEESRFESTSKLYATIPPYPESRLKRIKTDMVLRWEAGYWEDGNPVYTGDQGCDGYHTEFEGVITEVSRKNYYDGFDPDNLMRSDKRRDSLSIGIEAKDYMQKMAQAKLDPPKISGTISSIAPRLLSADGIGQKFGLTHKMLFNIPLINPSNIKPLVADTPARACYLIRNKRGPIDLVVGVDVYFRLKELQFRDPNDPAYATGNYPVFAVGDNVIEEDLVPRQAQFIQVVARWYDPDTGLFYDGKWPVEGERDYITGQRMFGGKPVERLFNIEGDGSGNPPNVNKEAGDIYARIAGDGLVGTFLAFGYPPVHRGDIIIYAGNDPTHQKAVLVDKVIKVYDAEQAKFRQEISPGFTPTPILNPVVGDKSIETFDEIKKSQSERASEIKNRVKNIISAIRDGGGR